jgi:formate hydrogenlyase subunit 6/NADH:ubiquinone oxidoreductase subunit I
MKIGSMLGEIIRSVFRKPATVQYPFGVRQAVPDRLRGVIQYDPEKCTGCTLCMKDCPANAIEILAIDKPNKRFIMRFHADRCTYCAQCVVNCRFKCITMSNTEWERAALTREPFTVYYGRDEDLKKFVERTAAGVPEPQP